jgi:hypothetical protein
MYGNQEITSIATNTRCGPVRAAAIALTIALKRTIAEMVAAVQGSHR